VPRADEHVVPGPALTVYHPFRQIPFGGRLFVQTAGDPYTLVTPVTRIIREISADQPVARAATLADVRADVLAPERLNAFVFSGFAGVALLIAVVGVAGVLAFSVSARTREFGLLLAIGSTRRCLLARVLSEGALIAAIGIVADRPQPRLTRLDAFGRTVRIMEDPRHQPVQRRRLDPRIAVRPHVARVQPVNHQANRIHPADCTGANVKATAPGRVAPRKDAIRGSSQGRRTSTRTWRATLRRGRRACERCCGHDGAWPSIYSLQ